MSLNLNMLFCGFRCKDWCYLQCTYTHVVLVWDSITVISCLHKSSAVVFTLLHCSTCGSNMSRHEKYCTPCTNKGRERRLQASTPLFLPLTAGLGVCRRAPPCTVASPSHSRASSHRHWHFWQRVLNMLLVTVLWTETQKSYSSRSSQDGIWHENKPNWCK